MNRFAAAGVMDEQRRQEDDAAAERRAKLARLRGELSVQDRDITSAPSLTVVDEFQQEFSAADKRSGLVDRRAAGGSDSGRHTIFYADKKGSRKESDLDYNPLVHEATRRGGGGNRGGGGVVGGGGIVGGGGVTNGHGGSQGWEPSEFEDTDLEDEPGFSVSSSRSRSAGVGARLRGSEDLMSVSLADRFREEKTLNLDSSITKVKIFFFIFTYDLKYFQIALLEYM